MASISTECNGRRVIQVIVADGKRKSIRLGKVSQRQAESVRVKVEDLAAAAITGQSLRRETASWLAALDERLYEKLAAVGLAESRGRAELAAFIDGYIASRADVKPGTRVVYERVRGYLTDYFGEDKPLQKITPGDADAWRLSLLAKGLSENTVRRSSGLAKQLFKVAVRRRILVENPFVDLPAVVQGNSKRFYFVSREETSKVLKACPDAEWRLTFALARYGGLRIPSEMVLLRWSDIDWAENRFTVTSPKTERHEGGHCRVVPIFPELRPYLLEAFEQAEEGAEFCITRYRSPAVNLRTQLLKIIKRAGLAPWPKLWQNLRSSRATELADQFPSHVCTAWLGHTEAVADKHYRQVTDDHFAKAAGIKRALQNPVQQAHVQGCMEVNGLPTQGAKTGFFTALQGDALPCNGREEVQVGDTGFEPVTSRV